MKKENKDIQNFLKQDLKKIAILGLVILVILIASILVEKNTSILTRISESLL